MAKRRLGRTDIFIEPLVLGTNVFGWTADEKTSIAVLDAFVGEGFSAIDTADVYSLWVPGNKSESEKIIGRWLNARGNRDKVQILTKVGSDLGQGKNDLSGFLSGKYRSEADFVKSPRGAAMSSYLDDKGRRILAAQDKVSEHTGAGLAEIALAWVNAQKGIAAPIASATSIEQLRSLARGARLTLLPKDLALLTEAGAA